MTEGTVKKWKVKECEKKYNKIMCQIKMIYKNRYDYWKGNSMKIKLATVKFARITHYIFYTLEDLKWHA